MTGEEREGLPQGWDLAPIRELLDSLPDGSLVHQGWSPKCYSEPAPVDVWGVLKTTAIQDGYFLPEQNKRLPEELDPKPRLEVKEGDVLLTCAGPRVRCGVPTLVRKTRSKLLISGKMYRMRAHPALLHPVYLEAFLRSPETQKNIDGMKTGISESGMNITHERFSTLEIPLPPLPEQIRIADKLDALLARVDAGRERLERVPKLIKQFRQAVLSAAVSGELTREWRGGGEAEWTKAQIQDVAFVGTGSTPLRSNPSFFSNTGTPWVTSAATGSPYISDLNKFEYVTEAAIQEHRLKRYGPGTLLVAMYGEGKTRGQVSELTITATINQACAAIVPDESKSLRTFIKLLLQSNYAEMRSLAEGGNQPNLNLSKIKEFDFLLPPLPEQAEIVRRVEALFALADRLEQRYQSALASFDRLTPALLAKAFWGELVPQDPNDEPASRLLERIRAQKAEGGRQKAEGRKARGTGKDGAEPKRRGRPPRAQAEGAEETAEPKRRGRPPGARAIPTALNEEDAVRLLQERGQQRAEGSRLVGLFEE